MRAPSLRPHAALIAASICLALVGSTISAGTASGITSKWYTVTRWCFGPCPVATAGSGVAFLVTARKFSQNPWTSYTGKVKFSSTDPHALLPAAHTFTAGDAGDHIFLVTFRTSGPQTLTATDVSDAMMHGTSTAVTISPAAAHHLAFSTQPTGAAAGSPLGDQPRVQIRDKYDNRVPSSKVVSLGLVPPPGVTAFLTCADTGTSAAAVDGIAVFGGCSVDQPGLDFRIVATASGLLAATSAPFTITSGPAPSPSPTPSPSPSASPSPTPSPSPPPSTAVVLAASATTVSYPDPVTLRVALAGAGAGRLVTLERRNAGATGWTQIGTIATDLVGSGSLEYVPARTAEYRAVWAGDATLSAATSASVSVAVRFKVIISPANTTRTTTAGKSLTWIATLRPVTAGVVVRFRVYVYAGGSWVLQAVSTKVTTTTGKATFTRKFSATGRYYMQATALAGPANSSASAPKKYVTVKRAVR